MSDKTHTHVIHWISARGRGFFGATFKGKVTAENKKALRIDAIHKSREGRTEAELLFPDKWSSIDNVFSLSISKI